VDVVGERLLAGTMQKSLTTDSTDGTDNRESRRRKIDRNTSPFGDLVFVFASTIFPL
jgi:hypothetical protein